MARPTKQGIDYFPLDVHLDDKVKFIEIIYGLEGFAVVIKLLQNIYANGYYYSWGNDERLIFAYENKIDIETLDKIINECLERQIFDNNLYEKFSILTSRGIQRRYQTAVYRRKDIEVVEEYLLIENNFGMEYEKRKPKKTTVKKKDDNKKEYGEFVRLTEKEYETLVKKHNKKLVDKMIEVLNNYKGSHGKKYKSDYRAILSWVEKRVLEENGASKRAGIKVSSNLGERRDDI